MDMMEETAPTDARDEMVDLMDQMARKMKTGDARINGWKEDSAWTDFGADGRKMARGWCGAKKSALSGHGQKIRRQRRDKSDGESEGGRGCVACK
jgi:hypothetical protein